MRKERYKFPKKKYQCFISSTYDDLREERAESIKAVLEAGQIPAGMEYFEAGRPQKEIIEKWMDESDVIIFLIGGRYGTIDSTTGNSYMEDEFNYAIEKGKLHFSIVLSDIFLKRKDTEFFQKEYKLSVFEKKNKSKYKEFRNKVCSDENVVIVDSIKEIKAAIIKNILNFIQFGILTGGWILNEGNSFTDVSEMDLKGKEEILFELLREKLIYTSDGVEEAKITNQFCNILKQYSHALERFMTNMARMIEITLYDEYIEVHNTINITYKLAENASSVFTYNPWMYKGLESETFEIEELKYNNENVESTCIERGVAEYTSNPFYVMNVIKAHIALNKKGPHRIKYSCKYKTNYDRYFHEYVFKEFCQFFSISVTLDDKRKIKNEREYMLKWGMFTPYKTYDHSSQNMLAHDKNKLTFNTADLMIPGNGYVITLNSAEPNIIKMKNDDK